MRFCRIADTCDQGIHKLILDENALEKDLEDRYETLSEAVQTVMRRYGIPEPYERLKEMTRGKSIQKSDIEHFVQNLDIPPEAKVKNFTHSIFVRCLDRNHSCS